MLNVSRISPPRAEKSRFRMNKTVPFRLVNAKYHCASPSIQDRAVKRTMINATGDAGLFYGDSSRAAFQLSARPEVPQYRSPFRLLTLEYRSLRLLAHRWKHTRFIPPILLNISVMLNFSLGFSSNRFSSFIRALDAENKFIYSIPRFY